MDCLRSFTFSCNTIQTFTTGGSDLKQWTTSAGNHYWQANVGTFSTYNIVGYKNIDVYGIDVIGTVQTQTNIGTNGVIVEDWNMEVRIGGIAPSIGASIGTGTNFYALDLNNSDNNRFNLGRYTNSLKLASPYSSCTFIQLEQTQAQGIGYQTTGSINLDWSLNFVVYYKFEGE
jgi:hypothetical protein